MEFNLEYPLTNFNDDVTINPNPSIFQLENDHMVSEIYSQLFKSLDFTLSLRREIISLILQLSGSFDPFISYLAVNYLDRFFSNQGMPLQAKPWVVRLLALTSVSLAAKMMKTEFCLSDFQFDEGFIFDLKTIERMEMLMLAALKWRMRSITPFAFLQFFTTFFKLEDPPLRQALKTRALEIIFKAQNEIKILEFKPSIVAACALLSASHELFPMQFPCFRKSISSCPYVNKEKLGGCLKVMEEIVRDGYEESIFEGGGATASSATAVNVLDHQLSSSASELSDTTTTNHKKITSEEEKKSRERKRQRLEY